MTLIRTSDDVSTVGTQVEQVRKAYSEYRDSGIPWLGKVPIAWSVERLKWRMLGISQGWSPQCDSRRADPGEWAVLKVGCMNTGRYDESENKALPQGLEPRPELEVRPGDILMSRSNTIELVGSVGRVHSTQGKVLLCDKLYRLIFDRSLDPGFAVQLLRSHSSRLQIERDATGASQSMKNISNDRVAEMIFAFPPLGEQRQIAAFLDRETAKIDELVAKKRRLIELLKEKRTALISHAVTKGLNPDAEMKDSGVEQWSASPESWRVVRLKCVSQFTTSGSRGWAEFYSDDGAVFLRITNLNREGVDLSLEDIQRVTPPLFAEGKRTSAQEGDLLISVTADIGAVGVVPAGIGEAYVNQHTALVRLGKEDVLPRWVAYCLYSCAGQRQFKSRTYGGTKEGIGLDDVKNLVLPVPDLSVQREIVQHLDNSLLQTQRLVGAVEEALMLLGEYRSTLISAAVTGRIDVRAEAETSHP